jgi:thiamine-phosphate pyrophosphorylase
VAEKRARHQLARAAARLAVAAHTDLPSLVLMTDDDRLPDPLGAVRALPRGSMVVARARRSDAREHLARAILDIARTRYLFVLIADDAALAARLGADGLHLPEAKAHEAAHWRALHSNWLITVSSHGSVCVPDAANAVFLSNVFATRSHAGREGLGPLRAATFAAQIRKPVYALGGIDAQNALRLPRVFAGIAAIGALSV